MATPLNTLSLSNLSDLPQDALVELAYLARQARLAHPRGRTDSGGRWYPDTTAEGGTPNVRGPSRTWPWSYMVSCRTRKWIAASVPAAPLLEDAAAAARRIVAGELAASPRLVKLLGDAA